MIKNVILDVGRVLIRWEPEEAMRRLGFEEKAVDALSKALFASGAWDEEDRGALTEKEILRFLTGKASQYETEICAFFEQVNLAIEQYAYAGSWISDLKEQGYGVYILSNYGRTTYRKTKDTALDFLQDVDGALFSFEVKAIKPEPAIYQAFFRRFCLRPEECIFLDDMPANIEGARAAGMHGIVFKNIMQAKEELKMYHIVCREYAD